MMFATERVWGDSGHSKHIQLPVSLSPNCPATCVLQAHAQQQQLRDPSCAATKPSLALKTGVEPQSVQEGFGSRGLKAPGVCVVV